MSSLNDLDGLCCVSSDDEDRPEYKTVPEDKIFKLDLGVDFQFVYKLKKGKVLPYKTSIKGNLLDRSFLIFKM